MLNFKSVNLITTLIFLGLLVMYLITSISIWWFISLFLTWFTLTAFGSALVGWNYHINILNANKNISKNQISITFDDGPNPEFTPRILDLLSQHNAKATFFCIGKHIETHPEIFKQIISEGHTIGNHTYSHKNTFGFFSTKKVEAELTKTKALINQISKLDSKLFRPAFGVTNPRISRAVRNLELTTIGWNKRSLDTTQLSEENILKRLTKNLSPGDVILLHDTSEKSLRVLEQLLLFLQEKNYQSVTIDTLFNIKAYA